MIKAIVVDTKCIDEMMLDEMIEVASNQAKEKSNNYVFLKDKKLSITSDIALQYLLSFETTFSERVLERCYSKKGKPFLLNFPRLFFNISHSDEKCAVAICHDKQIGIDIEHLDVVNEEALEKIWAKFFGDNSDFSKTLFIEKWTQIEAYYKMTGEGLNFYNLSNPIDKNKANIITKIFDDYFCSICIDGMLDVDVLITEFNNQEDIINVINKVKYWKHVLN